MRFIFWTQIAFSSLVLILDAAVRFIGGETSSESMLNHQVLLLVSAGFLWIHRTIVERKVKP